MNTVIRRGLWPLSLTLALFLTQSTSLVGHAQSAPTHAPDMLKWSMAKYAKITTLHADCNWSETFGALPAGAATSRTIWYKSPNIFKVVSTMAGGAMVQTSVSDGSKLVEYATGLGTGAQRYAAPPSIADATSMQMGHPMFCGSLLYKFFGGPSQYAELVDQSKQPVTFGTPETIDGQPCKTVHFYANGPTYGKTEVAIGTVDGLVHRIRYGSEPLMKMVQSGEAQAAIKEALKSPEVQNQLQKSGGGANSKAMQDALDSVKGNMPTSSLTTEHYIHITVGKPIESGVFSTKAPTNLKVQDVTGVAAPQPSVDLGKPAPAFSVTSIDGVKHSLANFKGKVVLIDFWATWCLPCRKGLSETQQFFSDYSGKGLAVLSVSDEPKETVQPFLKENKYTFPVYLDADDATNKTYKIEVIPTVVVIDKRGNLVAYESGLSPREDTVAALKKAGLKVK